MRIKAILVSALVGLGLVGGVATAANASPSHPLKPTVITHVVDHYYTHVVGKHTDLTFTGRVVSHSRTRYSGTVTLVRQGDVTVATAKVGADGRFTLTESQFQRYPNGIWVIQFSGRAATSWRTGLSSSDSSRVLASRV